MKTKAKTEIKAKAKTEMKMEKLKKEGRFLKIGRIFRGKTNGIFMRRNEYLCKTRGANV